MCEYSIMGPGERRGDDEMDLINAEFESMVAGLNLDQSTPRTYLDDLDDLEREEADALHRANRAVPHSRNSFISIFGAINRWWNRKGNDESDGAEL
jgi:hypothetical protein